MDKTIKEFLEESIRDGHIDITTFVEIQTESGETLAYSDAEDLLDSGVDCIDLCYSECDKNDDGSVTIIADC